MKLRQEDAEITARLAPEVKNYDSKYNQKLEKDLAEIDRAIDPIAEKLNWGRLHGEPGATLWDLRGELEGLQLKKIQLKQAYLDGKDKIINQLRNINNPYLQDYVESLLKEVQRLNGRKVFEILEDREDSERNRIFKVRFNFFHIHEVQKNLLGTCENLRKMECEPLLSSKAVFDGAIESIPETFRVEEQEGGSEFREFVYSNKPSDATPNFQTLWLHQAQFLSELGKKTGDWKKEKDQEVVEGLVKKHKGPIEMV